VNIIDNPSPAECLAEIQPFLNKISTLVKTAPISDEERVGLAILVAAHFFGTAAKCMGKDVVIGAREVSDVIVRTIRSENEVCLGVTP
jgi:hypothetical protein